MQTNISTAAGTQPYDLLSDILKVEIHHEEKISVADRTFCENQQRELYKTLDQLERWYEVFTADAERFRESHKISYKPNGAIHYHEPSTPCEGIPSDYRRMEFTPFETINKLVKSYHGAQEAFAMRIVRYFNMTYNVSVPMPTIDPVTLAMGTRPVYETYVSKVFDHLGGRSFRETAVEEILRLFHDLVKPRMWDTMIPQMKGAKISFPHIIHFDYTFAKYWNRYHVYGGDAERIETFCQGIVLGTDDKLNGGQHYLEGFNPYDVDLKRWYKMSTDIAVELQFYKNGRIDVKFEDAAVAAECFRRLHLDEITPEQEN